jgi:ATP-dependent Clp endopeptidase proteolytic subunit ClpP
VNIGDMDTLILYTDIQSGDAARFREQLATAGKAPTVRINSPGGSVFDGLAIANAIRAHGNVTVIIDGLAASIASLVAVAGKRVRMASNALVMIHSPWMASGGNATDLRRDAEALDRATQAMVGDYTQRTGKTEVEIRAWLDAETWFTADEALSAGLIDEIVSEYAMVAKLDISRFTLPSRIQFLMDIQNSESNTVDIRAALSERNETLKLRADAFCKANPGRVAEINGLLTDALLDFDQTADQFTTRVLHELGKHSEPLSGMASVSASASYGRNSHHGDFKAAAVDALLLRGGVSVPTPHPGAADLRGMTCAQIANVMVGHRGATQLGSGSPLQTIKSAMTTSDFPTVLANTASKALMRGYENEPASHRIWTRETFARDFNPQSRVAISEAPTLDAKTEGSDYTAGAVLDINRAPNFKLTTYGKLLILTREALVNDDLNAFTRLPLAFGASAARKEADLVYGMMRSNPNMTDGNALFSAAHSNLAATAAGLSVAALSTARIAMRKQKGPNGGYLNPVPRFLIVPAALETPALVLTAAETRNLVETTASSVMTGTDANPLAWIRELIVVVDPRLDDDVKLPFFLAAHHDQVDTMERVYLEGQRGVFIDEDQAWRSDNFELKARLDFATTAPDWVGMFKHPTIA